MGYWARSARSKQFGTLDCTPQSSCCEEQGFVSGATQLKTSNFAELLEEAKAQQEG